MSRIQEPREGLFEALQTGFGAHIPFQIIEATATQVRVRLEIDSGIRQGLGLVHGGALATLADITATIGAYSAGPPGHEQVTVELQTRFLSATREGPLLATALPLRVGRRLSSWEVRITDPEETLIAFATATFSAIEPQRPS